MKKVILILITSFTFIGLTKAQEMKEQFNFESKFIQVNNAYMHYIDEGKGDPILFLHGVPMSSYSYRNIIPHLSNNNRCIAIDFMGFGKSDKPTIDYSFTDQYNYLIAFIESFDLNNITLVMTDIGGILGTSFAMNHPEKIKGLVYMEAPMGDARIFHKNGGMMQHMLFWMGSKDKMGRKMFMKKNMMFKMMPKMVKRKMSKTEKEKYKEPFPTEESRLPLFVLPNSFPRKGKNPVTNDMGDFMNRNNKSLLKSNLPKLVLYAKPGMLINKKALKWIKTNLTNTESIYLGKGKHLMEEDLPNEIGLAIKKFLKQ